MSNQVNNHQVRAIELIRTGQLDKAEIEIRSAISIDPDDAWNYMYLGNIHYHRGDFAAALAEFQELAEVWPGGSPPHWAMGDLYRSLGEIARATDSYLAAVRICPVDHVARQRLRRWLDKLDEIYGENSGDSQLKKMRNYPKRGGKGNDSK
jgi:tetratricopeptide (TPR) repeat protein